MGSRLLIPVIMCGGAGTRLWPVSRESMPKQFVPLVEARSTFQQVLGRIRDQTIFDRPIVITNSDFRFVAAEQMRECAIEGDIVLEPMRRDSAMAVAVAAVLAGARDPASNVIVLAADHVVLDQAAADIVRTAEKTGAQVSGPIPLPTKRQMWTVLRSPHIDKKSREQFELKTHKRLIDILDSRSQTIDALTKLDLPAGVDVEIKVE